MSSEATAVACIRKELLAHDKPIKMNMLSVKLRWGQGDMKEFGLMRGFLEKYPEVFKLEGQNVCLCSWAEAAPEARPKSAPQAQQPPKALQAPPGALKLELPVATSKSAPLGSKAGGLAPFDPFAGARGAAPEVRPAAEASEPPPAAPPQEQPAAPKRPSREVWGSGPAAKAPRKAPPVGQAPAGEQAPWARPVEKAAPRAPTQPKSGRPKAPMQVDGAWEGAEMEPPPAAAAPARGKSSMLAPKMPSGAVAGAPAPAATPGPPPGLPDSAPNLMSTSKAASLASTPALPNAPAPILPAGVPAMSKSGLAFGGALPGKAAPPASPEPAAASQPAPPAALPRERWEDDHLRDEELSQAITECKLRGMELELRGLAVKIAPSDDYMSACRQVLTQVKAAVATHDWGDDRPSLPNMVGSVVQETELEGCDIDMALRFPPGGSQANQESCMEELWEKLMLSPQLAAYQTTRTFPHAKAPMTVELKGASPQTLAHLLVVDPVSAPVRQTTVDHVIKALCDHFQPARDLVRLVKLWASNRNFSNDYEGYPCSVAWTLMTISFLQKDKLMPAYKDVTKVQPSTKMPDLIPMLRRFFEFLASGEGSPARGFSVARALEFRAPPGHAVFVEDPAEFLEGKRQVNLAEGTGPLQWQRVTEEAKKTSGRLTSTPQRWFHWAEVFDPREVPPRRIAKLSEMMPRPAAGAGDGGVARAALGGPTAPAGGKGKGKGKGPSMAHLVRQY